MSTTSVAASMNYPIVRTCCPDVSRRSGIDVATPANGILARIGVMRSAHLLDGLAQRGLADNTIVIFTSDHGQTLGSHGGLTDKGWHHFEEIQRIPFIVRTPRVGSYTDVDAGTVLSQWVSLADVYPSLCEMAGCEFDVSCVHGRSILPLLRGEAPEWPDEAVTEFHGVNSLAATMVSIRVGDLKYGWNCANRDELYDLAQDPHETVNLIDRSDCAGAVLSLRERLAEWMRETGHPSRGMYSQSRLGGMTFRPTCQRP